MKVVVIFGGSGYIGKNLLRFFLDKNSFDKYFICDIKKLVGFDDQLKSGLVDFQKIDVRENIDLLLSDFVKETSWIFNLAAIHREPGHNFHEYFDTNIPGAENINIFAQKTGIQNLFFTSSIAPYGRSLNCRTEKSNLYPETAYGISKALAEKIHQNWLAEDNSRRLIIVRPSVIFGPKDPGNVYRMIKSLKKGTFILPNGGDVIKAYGYIFGLVQSIHFVMNKKERLIIYNYAENPLTNLKGMTKISKNQLNYKKPTISIPTFALVFISRIIQIFAKILGKESPIHPTRVKKASFPTNIKPQYLIDNSFEFKYDFENALRHWKNVEPSDFN